MTASGISISTHSEIRELLLRLLFHEQKNMLTVLVGRSALSEDKLQSAFYERHRQGENLALSKQMSWEPTTQQAVDFSLSSHRVALQYAQEMSSLNDRCRKLLLDAEERWSATEFIKIAQWWCSKLSLENQAYCTPLESIQNGMFKNKMDELGVPSLTSSKVLSFLSSLHQSCAEEEKNSSIELEWKDQTLKIKGF